jgi:hypothetical protein
MRPRSGEFKKSAPREKVSAKNPAERMRRSVASHTDSSSSTIAIRGGSITLPTQSARAEPLGISMNAAKSRARFRCQQLAWP